MCRGKPSKKHQSPSFASNPRKEGVGVGEGPNEGGVGRGGWMLKMCGTAFWNVGCLYSTNVLTSCCVIKLSYRLLVRECTCCWPFTTINFSPTKSFKSVQPSAPCVCISRLKNSQERWVTEFFNQYSLRFSFSVLTSTWREHQLFLNCVATESSGCNCRKCTHILSDCITLLEFVFCHNLWFSSSCYSNSRVNKTVTHKCSWFKANWV